MDPAVAAVLLPYLLHALAGGAGGAIRWWSSSSSWQKGLGHVFAGAAAGTFFGGTLFGVIKPLADFSGLAEADGELMGAHLAGVLAVNIYASGPDLVLAFVRSWVASKASTPEEPK